MAAHTSKNHSLFRTILLMAGAALCLALIYGCQSGLMAADKGQAMAIPIWITIMCGIPLYVATLLLLLILWKLKNGLFDGLSMLLHLLSLIDVIYLHSNGGRGLLLRKQPIPVDMFSPIKVNHPVAAGASLLILAIVAFRFIRDSKKTGAGSAKNIEAV